jgi:hypothetical protein
MPFKSQAQAGAMYSAAEGKSNLGIPTSVGQQFVADSAGQKTSPLPEYVQAQQGAKARGRTHRGRRSKGKGAKAHHAEGKQHIAAAAKAPTPTAALGHLFKAVRSMHAAKSATVPAMPSDSPPTSNGPAGLATGGY